MRTASQQKRSEEFFAVTTTAKNSVHKRGSNCMQTQFAGSNWMQTQFAGSNCMQTQFAKAVGTTISPEMIWALICSTSALSSSETCWVIVSSP